MKKILLIGIIFLLGTGMVMAQTTFCEKGNCTYVPLEPLPGVGPQTGRPEDFAALLAGIFKLLITLGSLFAVVMLVVAGIGYMLSEAAVDISKAKSRAKAALWGLLLLAMSWLILYTVNPELLKFKLLDKVGIPNPTAAPSTPPPASSFDPANGTSVGSVTIDNTDMTAANAQEKTFRQTCETRGGSIKPTGSAGGYTTTYDCFVPQYQI